MKRFIEEQAENDALDGTGSTQTDPVLLKLEPLLLGRIGDPFSPEDYAEAVKEAKRRADKEVPQATLTMMQSQMNRPRATTSSGSK